MPNTRLITLPAAINDAACTIPVDFGGGTDEGEEKEESADCGDESGGDGWGSACVTTAFLSVNENILAGFLLDEPFTQTRNFGFEFSLFGIGFQLQLLQPLSHI